jgi:Zn-dependent oligopeptidase
MGVVYMDLFPRPNKYTHAAHFTLRCGRKESEDEWQLPAVALVCNLPPPANGAPSLLSHGEVETVFHEFGHALHTLLSRTVSYFASPSILSKTSVGSRVKQGLDAAKLVWKLDTHTHFCGR